MIFSFFGDHVRSEDIRDRYDVTSEKKIFVDMAMLSALMITLTKIVLDSQVDGKLKLKGNDLVHQMTNQI